MRTQPPGILYIVNDADFFLSHRLPVAMAARDAGYRVTVAAPGAPGHARLAETGFETRDLPMTRSGTSIPGELCALYAIHRLIRNTQADIVHAVALKSVLYSGLALRVLPGRKGVLALTGLGYIFTGGGAKRRILRALLWPFLRLALNGGRTTTIFQNADDRETMEKLGVIARTRSVLIRGSGVDPDEYTPPKREPAKPPVVMMAARLLRDKGVVEYAAAARALKERGVKARFVLVGDTDPGNPTAVSQDELQGWIDDGVLEWWGHRDDMPDVLGQCHIFCLPSYREGLPKGLLEAASCARALITSDCPGCREVVKDGENGLLVPVQDADGLARAIEKLVLDEKLARQFGDASRARLIAEFSIDYVRRETLGLYQDQLQPRS